MDKYEKLKLYEPLLKKSTEQFDALFPKIDWDELHKKSEEVAEMLIRKGYVAKKEVNENSRSPKSSKATG